MPSDIMCLEYTQDDSQVSLRFFDEQCPEVTMTFTFPIPPTTKDQAECMIRLADNAGPILAHGMSEIEARAMAAELLDALVRAAVLGEGE